MDARVENFEGNLVAVRVGDYVSFKADVEACGRISAISGSTLSVVVEDDYGLERTHLVSASRAWIE